MEIQKFIDSIPRTVEENLKFRDKLNVLCESNVSYRNMFLELCSQSPQVFFDCLMFAFNPRETNDRKLLPFILRPKQIVALNDFDWCIENKHDFAIEKTRYEGATELVKNYVRRCFFRNNCVFIVGSLKKEDVDNRPDTTTIFAKIDNAISYLPKWFKVKYERKDMQIYFPQTNSIILGETTNENFSASRRADGVFLDEFGRLPPKVAETIEGAVRDVTDCIGYFSTHWYGIGHPFYAAINRPTTKKTTLFWHENPEKMRGAYTSPKENIVELIDEKYYYDKFPELIEKYATNRCKNTAARV